MFSSVLPGNEVASNDNEYNRSEEVVQRGYIILDKIRLKSMKKTFVGLLLYLGFVLRMPCRMQLQSE